MEIKKQETRKLSASEAVYGFCGWLTCMETKTIMSSNNDASVIAELVDKFCKTNMLDVPSEDFNKVLIHPKD